MIRQSETLLKVPHVRWNCGGVRIVIPHRQPISATRHDLALRARNNHQRENRCDDSRCGGQRDRHAMQRKSNVKVTIEMMTLHLTLSRKKCQFYFSSVLQADWKLLRSAGVGILPDISVAHISSSS